MSTDLIQELVDSCRYLYEKGWATSTSGNLSAGVDDKIYLTATGIALADVTRDNLAVTDLEGNPINRVAPTKEAGVHLAIYRRHPDARAVIHVHPANTIAVTLQMDLQKDFHLPSLTPQFVMRAGRVPVIPYHPPGSIELAKAVEKSDARKAVALQNYGLIAFASDFASAVGIIEETEANSQIRLLAGSAAKVLTEDEIAFLLTRKM